MSPKTKCVFAAGIAAVVIGICAETAYSSEEIKPQNDPVAVAVAKGIRWLVSVQGQDGGWGQDGGETSYIRSGERLESSGNDVANTAVAAEALLRAGNTPTRGPNRDALNRAIRFILQNVEQSPAEGLSVTTRQGTQIQRKLGPFIDTFLTSKLLAQLDGNMGDAQANARVRQNLQRVVAKIEKNQLKDGSWNLAGGWAPILGTSMASQSLNIANSKGLKVSAVAMDRVEVYTKQAAAGVGSGVGSGSGGGVAAGRGMATAALAASPSAGVDLYHSAQVLEQLSRTEKDRAKNAAQIREIRDKLSDSKFVNGFGSIGGEEFFSYLNISDSLRRTGGPEWTKWHADMNQDGTWAGHHCITGRVAVTSAAILTLLADREPMTLTSSRK
jgi:squalene-hopene cyclase-like protein